METGIAVLMPCSSVFSSCSVLVSSGCYTESYLLTEDENDSME